MAQIDSRIDSQIDNRIDSRIEPLLADLAERPARLAAGLIDALSPPLERRSRDQAAGPWKLSTR